MSFITFIKLGTQLGTWDDNFAKNILYSCFWCEQLEADLYWQSLNGFFKGVFEINCLFSFNTTRMS